MKLDNLFFLPLVFFGVAVSAPAESPASSFNVHSRSMSTDRPDTTESAFTVPTGMFQVEMSFLDFERDAGGGLRTEALSWGQMNVKAGLADDMDFQLVFDLYQEERTVSKGATTTLSGFGDVTVRLKKNLWGNDEGRTAMALMPYLRIPTGTELSSDAWQGGLILPFALEINERASFGLMAQMDLVHDDETAGTDVQWLASATVGVALTERWGGFLELVGSSGEDTDFMATFNSGLTFAVTETMVLDAGVRVGLNRAAPDLGLFSGVSFRF